MKFKHVLLILLFFPSVSFAKLTCNNLSDELVSKLEYLINTNGKGSISDAISVKSQTKQGDQIYHVIVELDASGLKGKGDHAIFAMADLKINNIPYATNYIAAEFFHVPDYREKLGFKASDPEGYDKSISCIKKLQK